MRIRHTEFAHRYHTYSFGYTLTAELEGDETPETAYAQGFLPKSDDPAVRDHFYMARSVRVPLSEFTPSSENRRIYKKFDETFETDVLDRAALASDANFRDTFLAYFADRHGQGVMTSERLNGILASALPLRGIRYRVGKESVAYILEVDGDTFGHYWYSCYTEQYAESSLGMWLMLDAVRRAKAEGCVHFYLGTAYGDKGRYKMNVSPLEFWDGSGWNADAKALKERIATDGERGLTEE